MFAMDFRPLASASGSSVFDGAVVEVSGHGFRWGGETSTDAAQVARTLRRLDAGLGAGPLREAVIVLGKGASAAAVLGLAAALEAREVKVVVAVRRAGAPGFQPSARVKRILDGRDDPSQEPPALVEALRDASSGCKEATRAWNGLGLHPLNKAAFVRERLPSALEQDGCTCDVDAVFETLAYVAIGTEPLVGKPVATSRTPGRNAVAVPTDDPAKFYEALPTDGKRVLLPGATERGQAAITAADLDREIFARRRELDRCVGHDARRMNVDVSVDPQGRLRASFEAEPGPRRGSPQPCVSMVLEEIELPPNPGGFRHRLVLDLPVR